MDEKFEQVLASFKQKLSQSIRGREESSEVINPKAATGRTGFFKKNLPITIKGEKIDSKFTVNSDCTCAAASEFIRRATINNLSVVDGPKSGRRLGIDGNYVVGLNVFWTP